MTISPVIFLLKKKTRLDVEITGLQFKKRLGTNIAFYLDDMKGGI